VWKALTNLDSLDQYDSGVRSSQLVGEKASGLGAQRRCDLRPTGWFIERVAVWRPEEDLAFELVTCSLPVSSLRHDYTLTQTARQGVHVQQRPRVKQWCGHAARAFHDNFLLPFHDAAQKQQACVTELAIVAQAYHDYVIAIGNAHREVADRWHASGSPCSSTAR
jgi:hypothetical protein